VDGQDKSGHDESGERIQIAPARITTTPPGGRRCPNPAQSNTVSRLPTEPGAYFRTIQAGIITDL